MSLRQIGEELVDVAIGIGEHGGALAPGHIGGSVNGRGALRHGFGVNPIDLGRFERTGNASSKC